MSSILRFSIITVILCLWFSFAHTKDQDNQCPPDPTPCIKYICDLFPSQCQNISLSEQVAYSCQGNFGSSCVEYISSKVAFGECLKLQDYAVAASSCRNVVNTDCIEYRCKKLGFQKCQSLNDITRVARGCGGTI